MAIRTISILNVMVFQRQRRKNNGDCKSGKIKDGINVLIGANGVGKTTILKMIYAATQWSIERTAHGKTRKYRL